MVNDDIANGLKNNRYLKTVRLVETFEDEILDEIAASLEAIMADKEELFDQEEGLDKGIYRNPGATYGTIRWAAVFTATDSDDNTLTLNMGIEWVEPDAQNVDDWPDPLLCYIYYKMKYASKSAYEDVVTATQNSDSWERIRFGSEQWDRGDRVAPGIFYVPVKEPEDVEVGFDVLADHFRTFAEQLVE